MSLSIDEHLALEHVRDRIKIDGRHNVNGCPYPTRALCPYKRTLKAIENRGIHVPTR